ncbi:MAG: phosphonate ABC transporter, permease protein PhnE [Ilumatobacteraceae bacterium]
MSGAHVEPLMRSRVARPKAPKNWRHPTLWAIFIGIVAATTWSWLYLDMTLLTLFGGFSDVGNLLAYMFPPLWDNFPEALRATIETIWMALIGTTLAVTLSIPLAFLAARNTTPHPIVFAVARGVITLTRAIPTLVLAAVFSISLGIGPFPGIVALGLHSIGMIGKLFTEAIENTDYAPREAVLSTGTGKWQTILSTIVPQISPSCIGTALYRLDINLRESAVLGFVGAGGVGFLIQTELRGLDYQRAISAVSVIFITITLIEIVSTRLRASIIGYHLSMPKTSNARSSARVARDQRLINTAISTRRLTPPWVYERVLRTTAAVTFLALLIIALFTIEMPLLSAYKYGDDLFRSIGRLFPPNFTYAREELIVGMLETTAIGFTATLLGLVFAIPFGILSARNIIIRRSVVSAARGILLLIRGLPELIVAVLFVAAMGLGPVPGSLALALGTATFMAKLIGDALEEVQESPREGVSATGASRVQEFFSSVLPQALPNLVSQTLYMLDVNLRSSTVLGIVGGGGIGFLLLGSIRVLDEATVGAIIITIFVLVYAIELLGSFVRWLVE